MYKKFTLIIILVSGLLNASQAQSISEAGSLYQTFPPGSRANAMGAAHTAVADDIYALYFNPAGLSRLQRGAVGFYHHKWMSMEPITFTGGVYSTKYGAFGFALNNFDLDTQTSYGEELNSYERALQITFAKQLGSHIALGMSIKLLQEKFDQPRSIADASASAWGLDVGILVQNIFTQLTYSCRNETFPDKFRKFDRPGFQGLSFGLALLNTGPDRFKFGDALQPDPLPQILRLGVAFNAMDTDKIGVLLALELSKLLVERKANGKARGFVESWFEAWDGGFDNLRFGAEINLYHVFAFRFGRDEFLNFSKKGNLIEWTWGVGLGPEWARLNLVRRSFPTGAREKWVLDFVLSY